MTMHMRSFAIAGLVALSALTSCTTPATQLLVVVDSDAPQPACYGVVVSRINEPSGVEPGATRTFFTVPMTRTPFSFGISPPGGDITRRVQVSVEMLPSCTDPGATDRIIRRTVRTGFIDHQTLRLPIFLNARCEACDAQSTCQESAAMCVPIPDVAPSALTPVVPGRELEIPIAPDAWEMADAGRAMAEDAPLDAFADNDAFGGNDAFTASLPDAFLPRDAGPPPTCMPLSTSAYQSFLFVAPISVTPRFSSSGWRVLANNGSGTTYWSTGLTEAPAAGGTLLLDTTGFSSFGALGVLASTTLPASDSVTVLGSPTASNQVYRWGAASASSILSTLGPLRPEGAIAHLGTDLLYAISDTANRTAIVRASTPTFALYTTTETNRESALVSAGGGAILAFGEGAASGRCEVRTISDASIVGSAINVPVAGQCAHVAVANLGMNRAVLVYVLASGGVNEVFAQEIDLTMSSLTGAPIDLGPARAALPARPQVWADASGAYRAVWPMDAAVGTASVSGRSVVNRHCITGPLGTNYESVRSARQGATTFVLVQGGGRSGQGLQYATLTD